MRVTISATSFDLDGTVDIETVNTNDAGEKRRRNNKVQTLDGGIAINDRGYSHGDRSMTLVWPTVSKAHNAMCDRLVENYDTVEVSFYEGVFLATPLAFTAGPEESRFLLSLQEKISA